MRPLVEPGPPLTPSDALRFSRHVVLRQVGDLGQRRLRRARVCVVGAGGLGSPALLYLAAAGVGRIGVVERDVVESTNLQRQVIHSHADVGRRKVDSARDAILALDPAVVVERHDADLTASNAAEILGSYDVVLDGTDNFATRYLVNDTCAALGIPLVWGSVLGFDAQVSVFWSAPPSGDGDAVDLRDLFPRPPAPGEVPSCAEAGVFGAMCGQVGSLMATEAIKLVAGLGEPLLGRVLVLDALAGRWREVPVQRASSRTSALRRGGAEAGARDTAEPPTCASASVTGAAGTTPTVTAPTITAVELAARLAAGEDVVVIDVREPHEHAAGAIAGALLIPLGDLRSGRGLAAIPEGTALVLHCATGVRSAEAVRLVRAAGRRDAVHLDGGIHAWWRHLARAVAAIEP